MRGALWILVLLLAWPAWAQAQGRWRPETPEPWEQATVACALLLEEEEPRRGLLLELWLAEAAGEARAQLEGARALLAVRDWTAVQAGPGFEDYLPVAMSSASYEREETLAAAASGGPVPETAVEWLEDVAGARLRVAQLHVVRRVESSRAFAGAEVWSHTGASGTGGRDFAVVDHHGEVLDTAEVARALGPPGALARYESKKHALEVSARILAVIGSSLLGVSSVGLAVSQTQGQVLHLPALGTGFAVGGSTLGAAAGFLEPLRRLDNPSTSGIFEEVELRRLAEAQTASLRAKFGAPLPDGKMRKGSSPDAGGTYLEEVDYEAIFEEEGEDEK